MTARRGRVVGRGAAAAALLAVLACAAAEAARPGIVRRGGGGDGGGDDDRGGYAPRVIIRQRDVSVPPPRTPAPAGIVREGRRPPRPSRNEDGGSLRTKPLDGPPRQPGIVRRPDFAQRLAAQRERERVAGRYYWHRHGGMRYVHSFYGGADWYGFWHDGAFFWLRPYGGFWWWYDPAFARWVYWYGDYWWWPGPGGRLYVYMDNSYYPYDSVRGVVTVKSPRVEAPPPAPPSPQAAGGSFTSPDRTRMVRVVEPGGQAFLFELSSGREPVFLKYLGQGAKEAGFSKDESGRKTVIIVTFAAGGYALFDEDGDPLDRPKPRGGG